MRFLAPLAALWFLACASPNAAGGGTAASPDAAAEVAADAVFAEAPFFQTDETTETFSDAAKLDAPKSGADVADSSSLDTASADALAPKDSTAEKEASFFQTDETSSESSGDTQTDVPNADSAKIDAADGDAGAATDAGPPAFGQEGAVCNAADTPPCDPSLKCCYPCGIPGCKSICKKPCTGPGCAGGCMMVP